MFGKYGRFMRGGPLRGTFYDDVLRVPLIIYHPKQKSIKINSLVSLIDLSPTILEFLDIKRPAEFEGQSLVATLKNDNVDRNIFAGAAHKSNKGNQFFGYSTVIAAVRNKEWKLIKELIRYDNNEDVNVSYELFNVKNDPEELHNLAEEKFGNLEEMNNILNEWMKVKLGKGNPFDKIYKQ